MHKSAIVVATFLVLGTAWAREDAPKVTPDSAKPVTPPSVATRTYKGTLVAASCAGNVTQKAPAASAESNAADRAASDSCAVTPTTKEFAMRTKEGRILRFDAVGNERTAEALKNKKDWSAAMAAGKPITAKVGGSSLDGDNVTVITID